MTDQGRIDLAARPAAESAEGDPRALALARLPVRPDRYRPIGDYAVIGDTRTVALVARDGSLDWLCLPNVDGASVFAALLDSTRGGRFFLGPPGEAEIERRYHPGSAVLITRFTTQEGVLEVTDFMPLALQDAAGPFEPARRIGRIARALAGRPRLAAHIALRPDYGARIANLRPAGRTSWVAADGRDFMLLQSELPLRPACGGRLVGETTLAAGEACRLSLSFCRGAPGIIPATGTGLDREQEATQGFWEQFCNRIDYQGPFREALIRSIVTLRLLTFSHSGAVMAAATTSLPEVIGRGRNWDYRFCWLRDAYFVLHAFLGVGLGEEGTAFFRWLMHATQLSAPKLRPLYSLFGRTDIETHELHTLEGYRGSAPVHVGNGAQTQLQLDGYGAMLVCARILVEHGGHLGRGEQRRLRSFADTALRDWSLPDNGIWEMRGGRKHTTYSKLMCWAALDSVVRLCERGAMAADAAPYRRERDVIRAAILDHAWNPQQRAFTGAFGRDFLDAALLLMPRVGFLPADDPRMIDTFAAIERELGHGAQMRRYPAGIDGFDSREGTFTACGFWAADYLIRRGERERGCARITELLGLANDVQLFAEETDPETGAQRGNFPQGFSHAGFVGSLLTLREAESAA